MLQSFLAVTVVVGLLLAGEGKYIMQIRSVRSLVKRGNSLFTAYKTAMQVYYLQTVSLQNIYNNNFIDKVSQEAY